VLLLLLLLLLGLRLRLLAPRQLHPGHHLGHLKHGAASHKGPGQL
jgi:hypothetical protein